MKSRKAKIFTLAAKFANDDCVTVTIKNLLTGETKVLLWDTKVETVKLETEDVTEVAQNDEE